jgi:hypothetical protein
VEVVGEAVVAGREKGLLQVGADPAQRRGRRRLCRGAAVLHADERIVGQPEGLLEFRRGRGITVAGSPQRGELLAKVRELVTLARRHGYHTGELIAMIEAVS